MDSGSGESRLLGQASECHAPTPVSAEFPASWLAPCEQLLSLVFLLT